MTSHTALDPELRTALKQLKLEDSSTRCPSAHGQRKCPGRKRGTAKVPGKQAGEDASGGRLRKCPGSKRGTLRKCPGSKRGTGKKQAGDGSKRPGSRDACRGVDVFKFVYLMCFI
jgi:hypothetical protein